MNRSLPIALVALAIFGLACSKAAPNANPATLTKTSEAAPTATRDPNPQNDPDVQRGYDEHQKEDREKREAEKKKNENFEVHPSGEPRRDTPKPPAK